MALWGTADKVAGLGTVSVSNSANPTIVIGSGTALTSNVEVKDVMLLGAERRQVASVTNATALVVDTAYDGINLSGHAVSIQPAPKFVTGADVAANNIYGVSDAEAAVANNIGRGLNTPGWNKYVSYSDMHGTTRYKVEPLCVLNISGDAEDDAVLEDS